MRSVVGWALIVVGAIWIGQGIGLIPGSFMTGSAFWAVTGVVCVIGGAVLLRKRRT